MLGANRTTAAEMDLLTQYSYDAAWWIDAWGGGANLVWMIEVGQGVRNYEQSEYKLVGARLVIALLERRAVRARQYARALSSPLVG